MECDDGRGAVEAIGLASAADAADIAAVRSGAAAHLTRQFGRGHWSSQPTEQAVLRGIATSRVLVARQAGRAIAVLSLATRKPWAIDRSYFADSERPLYLVDMAVAPEHQRRGVGRRLVQAAVAAARAWPVDAIRLDAYDADAGAGPFYAKCGFREVGRASFRTVPLVYYEMLL